MNNDRVIIATTDDVTRQLDKLKEGVRDRALIPAMNKALAPVLRAVKKNTPVRSGITKKAMIKKVRKYSGGTVFGIVGVDASAVGMFRNKRVRPNNILHLVEGGTKKHYQPKRKVIHPGAKPHPVIAPARAALGDAAVTAFAEAAKAELDQLTSKAGV